ncbi:MAG: hypothetical protein H6642_15690 [Caldilineaceae bacterium]|nr:hypothetical protein [Caldilineaceae bacterium]
MWNNPRVLRIGLLVLAWLSAIGFSARTATAKPLYAAACGDVVINEVLFNEDTPIDDEWVELYVVNTLPIGTVLRVQDNDSGTTDFYAEFTLAEEIVANRYIVVHGETEAGSQEPYIGRLNIYEAGDGYIDLANTNENIGLFVDGTICEEVYWESTAGGSSAAFSAPSTLVFTGSSSIGDGESIARYPSGSGELVSGTTAELYNSAEGQSIGRNNVSGTLAVTLGYFYAAPPVDQEGEMIVHITWQTVTETGTAGFNLLALHGEVREQLNEEIIASQVIDSIEPVVYTHNVATDATQFMLQEISVDGGVREMGPFVLGEAYGTYTNEIGTAQSIQSGHRLYVPIVSR